MLWLHVVRPNLTEGHYGYIADEYERHVILRGVNVETEQRNIPDDQDRPIDPLLYKGQCPNGPERPNRVRIISRVHPRGVIGQLKQYFYNTTTSSFYMTVNCINRTSLALSDETLVYIPKRLNTSIINITGEAKLKTVMNNPDGSRLIVINPTCNGRYDVFVANSTNEINELYEQIISNDFSNVKFIDHQATKSSKIRTYELFQFLHSTAVKIGQSFAARSSKSTNKFKALQKAVEINTRNFQLQLNQFRN
ncbi:unnamed protein product [Adineta ricciae]|uniref:Uncharacterized protein n=1 Tax=Adineta ricciae TaxID=249248 RepID=A0A815N2G6_ADIRI|nr:unnamed protein product [Adineta ricciae]